MMDGGEEFQCITSKPAKSIVCEEKIARAVFGVISGEIVVVYIPSGYNIICISNSFCPLVGYFITADTASI